MEDKLINKHPSSFNILKKIFSLFKVIENWYLIPIDRLRLSKFVTYKIRGSTRKVLCRSGSTDIKELIVIFLKNEYPLIFLENNISTVLDVGGNIGLFTIYLNDSKLLNRNSHIYIFEPYKENISVLKKNLSLNRISNATIIEKAVTNSNSPVKLDSTKNFDAVCVSEYGDTVVDSITLRDFCKSKNIKTVDLIKMDIEGAEYDIIANDPLFFKENVKYIFIEFHNTLNNHMYLNIKNIIKKDYDVKTIYSLTETDVLFCRNKYI